MRETVETKKISILYISPHGNTEQMAHAVASGATNDGIDGIDVASYHISHLRADEIRTILEQADALVFGIPTVARDIPKPMWDVLDDLSMVKLKTTIAGLFGSFGWNREASLKAEERLKGVGLRLVGDTVPATVLEQCKELGRTLAEEVIRKL